MGMARTWLGLKRLVNLVLAFSARRRVISQMNLRLRLRSRAPGSRPASVRIWKPLQMPMTRPPLEANSFTAFITGENRAMAPQRR